MRKYFSRIGTVAFLAVFALALTIGLFAMATPAQPAASAGYGVYPTIRVHAGAAGTTSYVATKTFVTAQWLAYETADVYAALDVAPAAIGVTITLKTQSSADGVVWVDGTTIWNGVSVDQSTTSRINALGAYYRFVATALTADVFTPTLKIVLK